MQRHKLRKLLQVHSWVEFSDKSQIFLRQMLKKLICNLKKLTFPVFSKTSRDIKRVKIPKWFIWKSLYKISLLLHRDDIFLYKNLIFLF